MSKPIVRPVRPGCWEFAMDFLGNPEEDQVRSYVEALEAKCKQQEAAIAELAKYFSSGNDVLVERATILAKDFWRITGIEPPSNE